MLRAEVGEAEREAVRRRVMFEDMGRVMRGELERWEGEKVEDFRGGVETFLEGCVEAQKEVSLFFCVFIFTFPAFFSDSQASCPTKSTIIEGGVHVLTCDCVSKI